MQSIIDSLITDKTPLGKDASIYQGGGAFQRGLDRALRYKREAERNAEQALANPVVEAKPVAEQESAINRGGFGSDSGFGIKKSNPFGIRTDVNKHYEATKAGQDPDAAQTDIGSEETPKEEKKKKFDWGSVAEALKGVSAETPQPGGMITTSVQGGGNLGTNYNPFRLY